MNIKRILYSKSFIDKIAQSVMYGQSVKASQPNNLQGTINKARTNADLQPLYKDIGDINTPQDNSAQLMSRESNKDLSHMNDHRVKNKPTVKSYYKASKTSTTVI